MENNNNNNEKEPKTFYGWNIHQWLWYIGFLIIGVNISRWIGRYLAVVLN